MSGLIAKYARRLDRDDRGQATVEYTLLLGVFAFPTLALFTLLLSAIAEYYRMIVFMETLPFP